MECSQCGYLLQPFEQECPRCLRQQRRAPSPASNSAATPVPAAPAFVIPAPAAPNPAVLSPLGSRINFRMFALVVVLSIACIYLSGVVMGNYLAQQKPETGGVRITEPYPPAPSVPTVHTEPFHDPYAAQEQKDCAQFVGKIQNLEADRHTMMFAHSVAPSLPGQNPPRANPLQTLPVAGVEMWQMQTEAARLRKMSEDLERTPINGACYALRNDYRQYLVDIEEQYQQLIRAMEADAGDPEAAQKIRNAVYSIGIQRLHNDAARAETSLLTLCTIKSVPKVFRLDWRTDITE